MNTEQLKTEIEAVFSFVEKPKDEALSFHKDGCFQCEYLRKDLAPYQGQALPSEAIREIHQDMSCLSAQGWRWVLPSYLRFCFSEEAKYSEIQPNGNRVPNLQFGAGAKVPSGNQAEIGRPQSTADSLFNPLPSLVPGRRLLGAILPGRDFCRDRLFIDADGITR